MVAGISTDLADPVGPAGYTCLGQFVDHDLTMDATAAAPATHVSVDELLQGRSPALDLDSLYGRGPGDKNDRIFYAGDGVHLKTASTAAVAGDETTNQDRDGFDLPRSGLGSTKRERRAALIPDARNDENLAVAQTHLAFIRFHNRVVDQLASGGLSGPALFRTARSVVVKHYQWMLKAELTTNTPLWFYILREAEFNTGRLDGVGGRIVAEVFHRAMEGSRVSIVREPTWRPNLGPDSSTFRMVDLLFFAFEGRAELLNPLG